GVDAGKGLDQRRLAGPVLPHEAVHLAGEEAKADVIERLDAWELDGDSPHLDNRRCFVHVHLLAPVVSAGSASPLIFAAQDRSRQIRRGLESYQCGAVSRPTAPHRWYGHPPERPCCLRAS